VLSIYTRFPPNTSPNERVPCVINIFGLDAYRTEVLDRSELLIKRGWAVIGVDIPGTGDNPGEPNDPKSADRVWSSLLDWIDQQPNIDSANLAAWGISTGGYYASRIAHTHASRLKAVVSQGGCAHYVFDEEWIEACGKMSYPYEYDPSIYLICVF